MDKIEVKERTFEEWVHYIANKYKHLIDYDPFDFSIIPEHLMQNMKNYKENGEALGGFLYQVFSNNLFEAYAAADDYNQKIVLTYIKFIYNEMPFGCHGSEEIVKNWMKFKQEKNNE